MGIDSAMLAPLVYLILPTFVIVLLLVVCLVLLMLRDWYNGDDQ